MTVPLSSHSQRVVCHWRARASVAALETETNSLLIGTERVLPTVGQLEKFVTREMEAEQWVLASLFKAAQKELIMELGGEGFISGQVRVTAVTWASLAFGVGMLEISLGRDGNL